MNIGVYGIIILFGAFIVLLILNPNLSCFGKRLKSPLYPLLRKRKKSIKTRDFGFHLVDQNKEKKQEPGAKPQTKKTEDYGFRLDK
jgi:hypothetical protein